LNAPRIVGIHLYDKMIGQIAQRLSSTGVTICLFGLECEIV